MVLPFTGSRRCRIHRLAGGHGFVADCRRFMTHACSTLRARGALGLASLIVWLAQAAWADARSEAARQAERYWPQWRGPLATGVAPLAKPPIAWSEQTNV